MSQQEDVTKMHWKRKEKLMKEGRLDASGNWVDPPPVINGDPGDEDDNVRDSSTQKTQKAEELIYTAISKEIEKKDQPVTLADVSRLIAEHMAKFTAAAAGDQQAQEDLASASEIADPNDVLDKPVFYFSNQRLWIKNYRDQKTGRERKLPFGGNGFQFRLIDSRLEGEMNNVTEYCIYSWHTTSKKEVAHIEGHEWYDKLFWKDTGEAAVVSPNDLTWQMEAWRVLDYMSVETVRQEVINAQAGGFTVRMLPNLHDTKKMLLPLIMERLKRDKMNKQMASINQQESEVAPSEQLRRRAIAYEQV